ncbi:MAG: ABC transporter permease subunit [Candidatus Adiutrix sp.]|nr:ABC transporter permease subunit [Candidatus Adiutrix sp.]
MLVNAASSFSLELLFGDSNPWEVIWGHKKAWQGLWTPLGGTLKLIFWASLFAVPSGLSLGIYLAEYAPKKRERAVRTILETLAGLPSVLAGLFGFVLVLFLNKFFPANTCLGLASFCLGVLVLPLTAINTCNALKTIPLEVRLTAACVGLDREKTIFRVLWPQVTGPVFSGILMSCGRCAEDTAVILMTGAVASSSVSGLLNKFEALPFFIYYTSANYTDDRQLSQVFAAAAMLLFISLIFVAAGHLLRKA